jgi:hypothetical protein
MKGIRIALAAACALAAVLPAASASAAADPAASRGTLTGIAPLPAALRLAGAGPSWLVWYRSTAWNGRPTVVSGTVSVPAGRPPVGGWPVVSFGHGFGGVADACAPSRTGPSPWERTLQEALIGAGYAVAVTDYDGIGTPGESSIVDGPAEAYALIDIVRATRRLASASRTWVSIGYSLGGHAALWAGATAARYAPELRLAGTVGLAPFTQWQLQLSAPGSHDAQTPINPVEPFMGRTTPVTHPGFHPADWYTPRGRELIDLAGRICIDEMAAATAGVTRSDVYLDPGAASDRFTAMFAEEEVPLTGYTGPVRIFHGTDDVLPALLSEITIGQLAAAGVDVAYTPVPGADHLTLLPTVAPQVVTLVTTLTR